MSLKQYLKNLPEPEREAFAGRVGSTCGHLRNVGYGIKPCAPILAVAIEHATAGALTRQALRPDDYWKVWPDLAPPPGERSMAVPKRRRRSVAAVGV